MDIATRSIILRLVNGAVPEVIPTRVNGCTNFIPIAHSNAANSARIECVLNCMAALEAKGMKPLFHACLKCCNKCISANPNNPFACAEGCGAPPEEPGLVDAIDAAMLVSNVVFPSSGALGAPKTYVTTFNNILQFVNALWCKYGSLLTQPGSSPADTIGVSINHIF